MEKYELIIGKWYISTAGSYIKFKEIDKDNTFIASEYILYGKNSVAIKRGNFDDIIYIKELKDLSLIQPFLPEGHPDRFDTIKLIQYEIY